MSPKQPSKQKRAAQNRAQRTAREARKAAANAPQSSGATTSRPAARGGLLSRFRGGGAGARTSAPAGRRPTMAEARAMQPTGYRAALSAVMAAVAAIVLLVFFIETPVDGQGRAYTGEMLVADWVGTAIGAAQDQPGLDAAALADTIDDWAPDREGKPWAQVHAPFSFTLVLPLIGAGMAFWAVRRRSSSKVLMRTLYITLFGAFLSLGAMMLFLPVLLAVGVAMFQVRKAEVRELAAQTPATDEDGVIDVDGEELDIDDLDDDDDYEQGELVEAELVDGDEIDIADAVSVERADADDPR